MQPDFIAELAAYVPADEREAEEKDVILDYARRFPDTVLTRENRIAHITSSAFVVNAAGDKTLMAHHLSRGVGRNLQRPSATAFSHALSADI